jgi:hypothetical protein
VRPFAWTFIAILGWIAIASSAEAGPAITAPSQNQKIGSSTFYIRWQGQRGMQSYRLRLREDGQSTYWVDQGLTVTSFAFQPKTYNAEGRKFEVFVYGCAGANGTNCGDPSFVEAYVFGKPVILSSPANNATSPNRKPTFTWQPYDGIHPSSGGGPVAYTLTLDGTGASPQSFQTSATTFTPSQDINPAFQNPVRWSVRACTTYNCSGSTPPRQITLAGGPADALSGSITYSAPANGTTVNAGSQLRWNTKPGVNNYRICLNMSESGCHIIRNQAPQPGNIQSYTLTSMDLDARHPVTGVYYYRGGRMYWGIQGCTTGGTPCVDTGAIRRYVEVPPVSSTGGGGTPGTGGTTPQVSFAQHLYPIIASGSCDSCHQSSSNNPPYFPQKPDGAPANCSPNTIPFNTTVSASAMLNRLKCITARSQQGAYSQALGKIYVVPGSSTQSGLHWKAQNSSAPVFSSNRTINGVTKTLKEWIKIWLDQGANP